MPALVALAFSVALVVQVVQYGEWDAFGWTFLAIGLGLSILLALSLARRLINLDHLAVYAIEGGIIAAGVGALFCFGVFLAIAGLVKGDLVATVAGGVIAVISGCYLWVAAYEVRRGFSRPSSSSL